MLRTIGIDSIEQLYQHIPETLRNRAKIELPGGLTELAVRRRLAALASRNATATDWSFFLGGGIYHHFIPSAVDAVISRSEFATSYTPYQPEVSQGTLQALFEYQTLICQLTGMEISNAGVYDGASAAAEAVLMSRRIQPMSRRRVLMSRALHPHYRAVIATYLKNLEDMQLDEIAFDASGATDVAELTRKLDRESMCVIVGYPNFFGIIEDLAPIQAACASERHAAHYRYAGTSGVRSAKTSGSLGCGYCRRRGTEFGRSDDLGWTRVWFLRVAEKVRP